MVNQNFRAARLIVFAIGIMSIPLSSPAAEQGQSTATLSVGATVIRPLEVVQQGFRADDEDFTIFNADNANVTIAQCSTQQGSTCTSESTQLTWVTVEY